MKLKTPPGPFFLPAEDGDGDGGAWGGGPPLGFHGEAPSSVFTIPAFCAKSQKEINLTLKRRGLHLFVKDVRCCLNDDADSSKATGG